MYSFKFVLLIFLFEALVLVREVTRDVFLSWLLMYKAKVYCLF